jgi:hypothetical protein
MPSEEQIEVALQALVNPIEKYRSAVVTAAEEVRGFLSSRQGGKGRREDTVAAGLGPFAAGRIDVDRFASLLSSTSPAEDPNTLGKVEKAFEILEGLSSGDNKAFHVKVSSGTRLRDAVAMRLADIGRGFAAARIAGLATVGALNDGSVEEMPGPLAFDAWSSGERRVAPPLIVEVEGADLHATELAEFLDGSVKIVLLVHGESPPAPLVRLITPHTFVLQTSEAKELARVGDAEPPAVAALLPESAARFVHDPALGERMSERLVAYRFPDKPPRRKLGGISARQQEEELNQLRALATTSDTAAASVGSGATGQEMTSVDKLAAWLLSQTDLSPE